MGLTGDGSSLWFDKCLTIGMFEDTTMSVANMEHAGADATVSRSTVSTNHISDRLFKYLPATLVALKVVTH